MSCFPAQPGVSLARRRLIRNSLRRDSRSFVQFIKYGIAGCIATCVDIAVFFFLAIFVVPAMTQDDGLILGLATFHGWLVDVWPGGASQEWLSMLLVITVEPIADSVRVNNFLLNYCMAFLISNMTAYLLNRWFVFTPGRHSRKKEMTLFYVVSIGSLLLGLGLGWVLIASFHVSTTVAKLANIVVSVMINFVCRKFFVFSG